MDLQADVLPKCLEGFGINGVRGGGWKTVVITMVFVCGLDRVKKVLKYVFQSSQESDSFWWNTKLLTAKTKPEFLECKCQCCAKHSAFTFAAALRGSREGQQCSSHPACQPPEITCVANWALIFIITIFNVKDVRFFAGCQSPVHTCYSHGSRTWSLWPWEYLKRCTWWRMEVWGHDHIGHEKWSLMGLVGN